MNKGNKLITSQNQIIHCNKIQYRAYACIEGLVGFQHILVGGIIQVL